MAEYNIFTTEDFTALAPEIKRNVHCAVQMTFGILQAYLQKP